MKQRIDLAQLNELTDEQKEKLRDWWNPQWGDMVLPTRPINGKLQFIAGACTDKKIEDLESAYHENGHTLVLKSECLPLLSIGQMTHFLYEETNDWGIHYNDSGVCFYVYLSWSLDTAAPDRQWMNDDLCDALWEAVKHVL